MASREYLLLGLTVVTGIVDAVSFLGLGHIFTANMTGNVVFLGFALGTGLTVSPWRSAIALGAFAFGSICGGRLANRPDRSPARSLAIAMRVEMVLLACAAIAALFMKDGAASPASPSLYPVIVLTAISMGLRTAVVRKGAVPDLTTHVVTTTLIGLIADSAIAGGTGDRYARRILAIVALCGGAAIGAHLLQRFGIATALMAASLMVLALAIVTERTAA
jgi:uncharacterized membrane protein YoaK (UPF0700 family)